MFSLSICIPTRNESGNIERLLRNINSVLNPYTPELKYEVVVVDDSSDDTAEIAESVGARVVKGQGKGLGQAIIDGINAAKNDVVLVMDADGSHSPSAIPSLIMPIWEKGYEMVIGSRYCKGGDFSDWALDRKIKSVVGVKLMQLATGVKDSNSGFFAFKKSMVDTSKLNGKTWKIMLEVLFKGNWTSKLEVPITFVDRIDGESKRSSKQVIKDGINLIKLVGYKYKKFISFALVGGVGNIWHFGLLYALTEWGHVYYMLSAVIAVLVAGTSNYLLNHYITFNKDKMANKNLGLGWLKYESGNGIGDLLQLGMLFVFTNFFGVWYMLSTAIATGITVIFKYALLKRVVWGKPKRKATDADYEWVSYYNGLPWQKYWKHKIASIAKEFAEYPDGEVGMVLEAGCGSSPCATLINHKDYIGYDMNNSKIRYMNAKDLRNSSYITGGFKEIKDCVLSDSMDTVLFVEVIEHLHSVEEASEGLKILYSKLKPNGKLIVATPNFGGFMGRTMDNLYGVFQKGAYKEEHNLKFGLKSLKMLCEHCGFKHVKSEVPFGADIVCLFQKS